jgi:hypothetical protein
MLPISPTAQFNHHVTFSGWKLEIPIGNCHFPAGILKGCLTFDFPARISEFRSDIAKCCAVF